MQLAEKHLPHHILHVTAADVKCVAHRERDGKYFIYGIVRVCIFLFCSSLFI